jgi:hypothetical protein
MSAQHTPGPWRVEGHSGLLGGALAGHAITYGVNAYRGGPAGYVCKTVGTTDANARLIAAAPDMFAALQECADYLDRYADVIDGDDGQPEANEALRLLTAVTDVIAAAK